MAAAYHFLLLTNTCLGSIIYIVNGGSRTADGVDAICGYFFRGKLKKNDTALLWSARGGIKRITSEDIITYIASVLQYVFKDVIVKDRTLVFYWRKCMGKKSIPKRYCCNEYMSGKFSMVTPELLEHDGFQNLSYGAQMFYIVLLTHKETDQQRSCLFATLKEYNEILNLGMTDVDIMTEATPNARSGDYSHGYFVAPLKQLKQYGYRKANISRLKDELIEKGFIKIAFGGKGKYGVWSENVTVYQFIDAWKSFSSTL